MSGLPCGFLAFESSKSVRETSRDFQRLPETSERGRFVGVRISSIVRAGSGGGALAQVSRCAQAGACAGSRTLALLGPMCAPPLHVLDAPLVLFDAPYSLPPFRKRKAHFLHRTDASPPGAGRASWHRAGCPGRDTGQAGGASSAAFASAAQSLRGRLAAELAALDVVRMRVARQRDQRELPPLTLRMSPG